MIQFCLMGLFSLLSTTLLPGQDAAVSNAQPMIVNAHPGPEYGTPIPFRKVPGTDGTLEIADGRLYALESGGLSIYDITDPKKPKKLGHVGGMGNVRQLRVRGRRPF
jgi:hypothetical protein